MQMRITFLKNLFLEILLKGAQLYFWGGGGGGVGRALIRLWLHLHSKVVTKTAALYHP